MRCLLPLGFALISLLMLTGCVSSQELTTPSETLEDVNRKLEGRKAKLMFVDGDVEKQTSSVQVGPEFVTYRTRSKRARRRLTSELSQITVTTGNGGMIGMVAGALVVSQCVFNQGTPCRPLLVPPGGLVIATTVLGGMAGAVLGALTDRTYTVYTGPVERYSPLKTERSSP